MEIKFKIWNGKEWLKDEDGAAKYVIDQEGNVFFIRMTDFEDVVIPIEKTNISLYTGLKDKNGKEIYEGDIFTRAGKFFYAVVFHKGGFRLKLLRGGIEDMLPLSRIAEYGEVIGNIYENPELLEERS